MVKEAAHNEQALGTPASLPEHVREIIQPRSAVIAWTTVDPSHNLGRYFCVRGYREFACPCFWPHLLILWPCLWADTTTAMNKAKAQFWVLEDNDLKVVTTSHDTCCISGARRSENTVKTIPLSKITYCDEFTTSGRGCFDQAAGDIPTIYVDTADDKATGLGLHNYREFIDKVMHQRDQGVKAVSMEERAGLTDETESTTTAASLQEA